MYREWTRDFRRCQDDCQKAISHLEKGTLFEWYKMKTLKTKSYARTMLSGGQNLDLAHQLPDNEINLTIPSDLVTMERSCGSTAEYDIMFMTARIAEIVADVQEEKDWALNAEALDLYFRNPETRVAAGHLFQKIGRAHV